mgnify:CR=1 FL=1
MSGMVVLDQPRRHEATGGMLQMPRIASGRDVFHLEWPPGSRGGVVDLEIVSSSPLASATLVERPRPGGSGRQRLVVEWRHPVPGGHVEYRVRALASGDDRPPVVSMPINTSGSPDRLRTLVEQGVPVDLTVDGPLAQAFHQHIVSRVGSHSASVRTLEAISAGTIAVVIAIVIAVCVALGLAAFASVLIYAMSQGYDIEDAGYQVAVGEGASRQEHRMTFQLRPPADG